VLPEDPEYLSRGLQEFRQGRYDQAERQFFRAIPDSFLYLALTGLAQHNWREAVTFLARAMSADPAWLRKVSPQDLFGSAAAFDGVVAALDDQISKNPLDADLKILAAYLRYHEKGAAYAKALLVEAINVSPEHEAAKAFLETLGP
jgi:tetratricopeptide (TPR) repeat protein